MHTTGGAYILKLNRRIPGLEKRSFVTSGHVLGRYRRDDLPHGTGRTLRPDAVFAQVISAYRARCGVVAEKLWSWMNAAAAGFSAGHAVATGTFSKQFSITRRYGMRNARQRRILQGRFKERFPFVAEISPFSYRVSRP
ncbi:hypothetical protein [Paracoccus laeviglucosivorans]|uniref:hypothetical protein n=1 Tax=Paracoccus laeviglucosivorans TaxID=1197861 RepID=UPI00115B3E18|nr:hypothetical protein [Paracoccus laeviglucosivorans]